MAKFFRKNQSRSRRGCRSGTASANGKGGHDRRGGRYETATTKGGTDTHVGLLKRNIPEIDLDAWTMRNAAHTAEHEKTAAKQPRKKKQHRKETKSDALVPHAEDGDFEAASQTP
jgi:hypothetical protein